MTGTDRLPRLLALVPYLLARPGIRISEAAAGLGITDKQLRDDLQLLFVCGLPGYGPGDLIDMSLDDDTVTITYDAGMDRPLRLTADEALALVVALRSLAEVPGVADGDAVGRALAKVEAAAGDAAGAAGQVAVQTSYQDSAAVKTIRSALENRRALQITYYTAGRDATSERVIDPMRLVLVSGLTYVEAWCRKAGAVRMFRADRIDEITELEERSAPPPEAVTQDVSTGVFQSSGAQPLVTLRIARAARWITEYYPCEDVRDEPDGRWLVSLRASDLGWARRLVLSLGHDVEVMAPAELAADVRAEAAAALAAYEGVTAPVRAQG
ncbi:MAG: proteasome accessory factor [Cryptosporangiaceae bacterium]|jgi:proteasome accessory factor C|nr:proteasome accessory factor [Cryptosporangiaceae bacterium]